MAGLGPAIHVFAARNKDVDAGTKSRHDAITLHDAAPDAWVRWPFCLRPAVKLDMLRRNKQTRAS